MPMVDGDLITSDVVHENSHLTYFKSRLFVCLFSKVSSQGRIPMRRLGAAQDGHLSGT